MGLETDLEALGLPMTDEITRREFQRTLAAGLGASLAVASDARADDKPAAVPETPATPPLGTPEELYVELVKQAYPDAPFNTAAWDEIRGDIAGFLARGKTLAAYPLKNSDEPAHVFSAWRNP